MVGIFNLGNKGSPSRSAKSTDSSRPATPPPPPYSHGRHDPSVFATETTTTTMTQVVTTTTQTTTHFFSLPLWRRRAQQTTAFQTGAADRGPTRASADELGMVRSAPVVYLRDKDLPPTPPAEELELHSPVASHEYKGNKRVKSIPQIFPPEPISSPEPSPVPSSHTGLEQNEQPTGSTAILARAALGLGLPPLNLNPMPAPSSSSAVELNAVSFAAPPIPPSASGSGTKMSQSTMRRAKSFQRLGNDPSGTLPVEVRERRRTRGLSLGPLHFGSTEEKVEKKDPERKILSRKGSFWSRKRNDSRTPAPPAVIPPSATEQFLRRPSLPSLMPVSPFRVDTNAPEQPPVNLEEPLQSHSANLRRRHSERSPSSKSPPASPETSTLQSPRRTKRPQTADSPSSPRVASSFSPGSSSYFTSHPPPVLRAVSHGAKQGDIPAPAPQVALLRPRSQTNPPFLHRLSMNLFGSSPASSPVNGSVAGESLTRSPRTSLSSSSRPSVSRQSPKVSIEIPRPHQDEESPEVYVQRLMEAVSKSEVASVLASSADGFYAAALRAYISRFDFSGDPLDVALRRLLMEVGLPRETQQIDRVIEAFAERYRYCHPDLFVSEDHPYIIAFSLIMLHTDAFNKSNKRKMTKADYVKNTRLPGVPPEVLDCFFDNIVFAPFIFIEDPFDVNGQRSLLPDASPARRMSTLNVPSPGGLNSTGSTLLSTRSNKIDPYYLITRNLLDDLRVDVQSHVPATSPYFYHGMGREWDDDKLLLAFAKANTVEFSHGNGYLSSPWFGLSVGGGPNTIVVPSSPMFPTPGADFAVLKVVKVGLMLRKEEVLDNARKSNNRKWREWSVLLTGSQLLWSRDPAWAGAIQAQIHPTSNEAPPPHGLIPKPDEMFSVRDAVAVFDRSYNKYRNTFRLVMSDRRHFLLQVKEEKEMDEWIACINYASAFKTAGVRMRSLGMSGKDIELTGQAAAVSHLRDMEHKNITSTPPIHTYGTPIVDPAFDTDVQVPQSPTDVVSITDSAEEPLTAAMDNSARLFKATFDQVKADLAAGKWQSFDSVSMRSAGRPRAYSLESTLQAPTSPSTITTLGGSSRARIIKSKVQDLESRISAQQTQLDSDLRFVRNVAVLTPFQRATRDRLQAIVQTTAKRIMQVRLEMERLTCHRDVLTKDLRAEERDWQRTKKIALKAATEKLCVERKRSMPRMTLSSFPESSTSSSSSSSPIVIPRNAPSLDSRPESSATESFRSVLEDGTDWVASSPEEQSRISSSRAASQSFDIPNTTSLIASSSWSSVVGSSKQPQLSTQSSLESTVGALAEQPRTSEDRFYPAPETPEEQAEDWNKTRAAKRVSLVRLPSDLRMSSFFGRHSRFGSDVVGSDASTITPSTSLHRSVSSPSSPFARTNAIVDNVAMLDL